MFKKILFTVTLLFFFNAAVFSQKIMHSVGTSISVMFARITTDHSSESFALSHTDFTYFPRYIVAAGEKSSFSIGAPISAGVGLVRDDYSGGGNIFRL